MPKLTISYFMLLHLIMMILFIIILMSLNMNSLIISLMFYSILTCLILSFWSKNFIYSIIMFLTLISGLLVIFLYFTSLISNMKNNFFLKKTFMIFSSFIMNITMFFIIFFHSYSHKTFYALLTNFCPLDLNLLLNLNEKMFSNIIYIYFYPFNNFLLLCMFFLLLSLFSIIKICTIKNSTLRKIK